jgi:hypothetical protein
MTPGLAQIMVDPVDLIFLPILGDTIHHPPTILCILAEGLFDDQPIDLAAPIVVLLDHVGYLGEGRGRQRELEKRRRKVTR